MGKTWSEGVPIKELYRKGRDLEKEGYDPRKYVELMSYDDITIGNILAIYLTKSKNKEWTLFCTIGQNNILISFNGNMDSLSEEELNDILQSVKGRSNTVKDFLDLWVC